MEVTKPKTIILHILASSMKMARLMGIDFAPLNTPIERRLQTLATLCFFVIMVAGGPLAYIIMIYMFFCTSFYWLALAYFCYIIGESGACRRGSYPSDWVRRWAWWRYYRDYYPVKLVKTADLDPSSNYLFCCYPHGVLPFGVFTNFATEANDVSSVFPGIRPALITLEEVFMLPVVREVLLRLGACSSSEESLNYLLNPDMGTGTAVLLIVGGVKEALQSKPGDYHILLKERKGFARVALKNGSPIVPVYSFGENEVYTQLDFGWLRRLQHYLRRKFRLTLIVMIGRGIFQYSFGFLPFRRPLTTVVGKPIPVERTPEPTEEQIDDLHRRFTQQLVALFEEHKHKYFENPEAIHLIVE